MNLLLGVSTTSAAAAAVMQVMLDCEGIDAFDQVRVCVCVSVCVTV